MALNSMSAECLTSGSTRRMPRAGLVGACHFARAAQRGLTWALGGGMSCSPQSRMLLMRVFVQDWRGTLGSLLLILAVVCIAWWIRSRMVFDRISFAIGARQHELTSIGGHTWWCSWEPVTLPTAWSSSQKPLNTLQVNELFAKVDGEYRHMSGRWGVTHRFIIWGADHWSFTVPLTSLATCLILWPGKKGRSASLNNL